MLYILGGLPGTGKTTLAKRLAKVVRACHLRIDTIEHALRRAGVQDIGPLGYEIAYGVALDNLHLGIDVVADSVNPLPVTRDAWRNVAQHAEVAYREIEILCSNSHEHRTRVESRTSDIVGFDLPTWKEVENRHYVRWDRERVVIDTADKTPDESAGELFAALGLPLLAT